MTRNLDHRDYVIWRTQDAGTEGNREYLCVQMYALPDDQSMTDLSRSVFMYGWLRDTACWHAVYSDEAAEFITKLMSGATFTPVRKQR